MKKAISLFLCLNILFPNLAFASLIQDELALKLDKNLKINPTKQETIKDELVFKLNPNLKITKEKYIPLNDNLIKYLDSNLKIQKHQQITILPNITDEMKIKIHSKDYITTRTKLFEGKNIDFVLAQDTKIKNIEYKKGTIIKARIETISQNGAYGVPADLVVGNFTLPNNTLLEGQIAIQGANRSLWVYPTGYLLTCFFFIGLPIFAIRGGHAKLRPSKIYEVGI